MIGTEEDVRVAIYRGFAVNGTPPSMDQLAHLAGSGSAASAALDRLVLERHVVLDSERQILMAHPFASIPLGFSVMGRRTLWWGGCAWDSFALPHLLEDEPEVLVATQCPGCENAHAWVVGRNGPPLGEQVAHFLTPAAHIWDDVVHTCAHQRIFCDEVCVDSWLAKTGNSKGYLMDLATLHRLAAGWYAGRLDHGYTRRDPAAAADYFRSVGLSGEFWGL